VAKSVLVTGFEPFGGDKVNPSEIVARSMEGRLIAGRPISTHVFPVETRTLRERFEALLVGDLPDLIVALGQSGGRASIALERVAVNVLDFTSADNVGVMRKNDQIARGGPEARISNLPFERILEAWHENGVPGYVSNTAGTFVCNQALYELLALTEHGAQPILVGLVHLPYLPLQAIAAGSEGNPSMSFETMKKSVELLVETVVGWMEHRTPEASRARTQGHSMWIPRGVKEVER
jgi:pyroglutamyl-peptidase